MGENTILQSHTPNRQRTQPQRGNTVARNNPASGARANEGNGPPHPKQARKSGAPSDGGAPRSNGNDMTNANSLGGSNYPPPTSQRNRVHPQGTLRGGGQPSADRAAPRPQFIGEEFESMTAVPRNRADRRIDDNDNGDVPVVEARRPPFLPAAKTKRPAHTSPVSQRGTMGPEWAKKCVPPRGTAPPVFSPDRRRARRGESDVESDFSHHMSRGSSAANTDNDDASQVTSIMTRSKFKPLRRQQLSDLAQETRRREQDASMLFWYRERAAQFYEHQERNHDLLGDEGRLGMSSELPSAEDMEARRKREEEREKAREWRARIGSRGNSPRPPTILSAPPHVTANERQRKALKKKKTKPAGNTSGASQAPTRSSAHSAAPSKSPTSTAKVSSVIKQQQRQWERRRNPIDPELLSEDDADNDDNDGSAFTSMNGSAAERMENMDLLHHVAKSITCFFPPHVADYATAIEDMPSFRQGDLFSLFLGYQDMRHKLGIDPTESPGLDKKLANTLQKYWQARHSLGSSPQTIPSTQPPTPSPPPPSPSPPQVATPQVPERPAPVKPVANMEHGIYGFPEDELAQESKAFQEMLLNDMKRMKLLTMLGAFDDWMTSQCVRVHPEEDDGDTATPADVEVVVDAVEDDVYGLAALLDEPQPPRSSPPRSRPRRIPDDMTARPQPSAPAAPAPVINATPPPNTGNRQRAPPRTLEAFYSQAPVETASDLLRFLSASTSRASSGPRRNSRHQTPRPSSRSRMASGSVMRKPKNDVLTVLSGGCSVSLTSDVSSKSKGSTKQKQRAVPTTQQKKPPSRSGFSTARTSSKPKTPTTANRYYGVAGRRVTIVYSDTDGDNSSSESAESARRVRAAMQRFRQSKKRNPVSVGSMVAQHREELSADSRTSSTDAVNGSRSEEEEEGRREQSMPAMAAAPPPATARPAHSAPARVPQPAVPRSPPAPRPTSILAVTPSAQRGLEEQPLYSFLQQTEIDAARAVRQRPVLNPRRSPHQPALRRRTSVEISLGAISPDRVMRRVREYEQREAAPSARRDSGRHAQSRVAQGPPAARSRPSPPPPSPPPAAAAAPPPSQSHRGTRMKNRTARAIGAASMAETGMGYMMSSLDEDMMLNALLGNFLAENGQHAADGTDSVGSDRSTENSSGVDINILYGSYE